MMPTQEQQEEATRESYRRAQNAETRDPPRPPQRTGKKPGQVRAVGARSRRWDGLAWFNDPRDE